MKRSHATRTKHATKHAKAKQDPKQDRPTVNLANLTDHPSGSNAEDYPAGSPLREQMRSS